ncbi:MAG: hypothetical protein IJW00_06785 [Clostridia bacterium]|nr:hypothetical protein [Clostridia bacterium]
MKRFLVLMMALLMCLGCFAACTQKPDENVGATLSEAVEYLKGIYKDNAKETPADYDVVGKIVIGDATFTVTWTTDNANIVVKEGKKAGFYTVDLPAKNDTVTNYKLTATVADGKGNTESVSFDRTLPVYDASAIVAKPEEGVAYKFYMVHTSLGQTLFAKGETQDNANKYILSTTDPKAAPDFYVEADGEGFKFYTELNGTKTYILAKTTTSDDGKVSKYIGYSTEEGTTWTYKSETNGWYTTIDGTEYVVGTYGTYNTFCISEGTYLTVENSGVSQFPGGLMLKEVAEAMTPSEGPTIYETPEEIVNAAYALELGGILSGGHTYTLTGVITDIPSPYDASYGNVTVVIVVGDMNDKPIECFRLKGEGIENLEVGDTITVSGQILKYDNKSETGKVEFNTGCTLVSSNACAHVEEVIPGKAATCTETGMTDGKKCTTCGDILVEQTEIPALGHDWNAVMAHDDDNHWSTCTRCDEIKDKAAHNNGDDSVCDTCGYGCEHKDVNEATCTTPATCKDCGANTAPAKGHTEETVPAVAPTCKDTGLTEGKKCSVCGEILVAQETVAKTNEHTYDDAKDATCNVCGFEREIAKMVVIYYPKAGMYLTGTEYLYTGKNKMELVINANKAEAIAMEQITNADGSVSFKAGDKWLYADNTHVEFVSAEGPNTKFVIEETDGGVFLRCHTANFNGNPQYLEVYGGDYLTVYGKSATADPSIYTFQIQDADGANGTVKDDAGSLVDKNSTPSTPSTGSLDAKTPEVGKAYKFAFIQENVGTDIYYLTGAKSSYYMATSKTKADGADFYVESTNGGYYLYCMVGGAKKYVNMVVSGTHVNGEFQDTATTVYTYDTTLKTLVGTIDGVAYVFGTNSSNTYTTLGPVKTEYNPFYAQFIQ